MAHGIRRIILVLTVSYVLVKGWTSGDEPCYWHQLVSKTTFDRLSLDGSRHTADVDAVREGTDLE